MPPGPPRTAAGAPSQPTPPSTPSPDAASDPVTGESTLWTRRLLREALNLRGTPYRNGGSDPGGFDCSGFTQWVFARVGVRLPRETRDQFHVGEPVHKGEQQPGDLIFFTTVARGASHVGIALGNDTFVHAPSSTGVVRIESLTQPYWAKRLVGVRRVTLEAN